MSEILPPPQTLPVEDLSDNGHYMETTRVSMALGLVGREEEAAAITDAVFAGQDVLLTGPPGLAKTKLVNNFIELFKEDASERRLFGRFQGTSDKLPAELLGGEIYNPKTGEFYIKHGPINSHFLFFDEINRANPKTQSAANEAMEEGQITLGNETVVLPDPFIVLATKNDLEYGQTEIMTDALTDRFDVSVEFIAPKLSERNDVIRDFVKGNNNIIVPKHLTIDGLRRVQEVVRNTPVSEEAMKHLASVVHALVGIDGVELVSPGHRSGLSGVRMAQANAVRTKQAEAGIDQMNSILPLVLTHRVKSKDDGATASDRQAAVTEAIKKAA